MISNILNKNPDCEAITVARENGMKNVAVSLAVAILRYDFLGKEKKKS